MEVERSRFAGHRRVVGRGNQITLSSREFHPPNSPGSCRTMGIDECSRRKVPVGSGEIQLTLSAMRWQRCPAFWRFPLDGGPARIEFSAGCLATIALAAGL